LPLSVFVCHPERSEGPLYFAFACFYAGCPIHAAFFAAWVGFRAKLPSQVRPMPRRLALAFTLLLALAAPLRAQPPDSALTQAEIDQVREYRYYPADCVLLFVKFLDLRTQQMHDLYAHPRRPGREQDTHDLIAQFTSIADELSDNLDDYGPRHVDLRRALPKILTAIPRWSAALNALPDDDAYNVARRLALESLRDLREDTTQLAADQAAWFKAHPPNKSSNDKNGPIDIPR